MRDSQCRIGAIKLGGGVIVYVRDDIPNKQLIKHKLPEDIQDVFVEVNLRKSKLLIFEAYKTACQSVKHFFKHVGFAVDTYTQKRHTRKVSFCWRFYYGRY